MTAEEKEKALGRGYGLLNGMADEMEDSLILFISWVLTAFAFNEVLVAVVHLSAEIWIVWSVQV